MTDARLRRLAIQIAGQLPQNIQEAHTVLRLVGELVDGFMTPRSGPQAGAGAVLALRRPQGGLSGAEPIPEVPAIDAPEVSKP